MTSRSRRGSPRRKRSADNTPGVHRAAKFAESHERWRKAVARLEATIARIKEAPAPMGNRWQVNQVAYFEAMLGDLKAQEPTRK